MVVIEEFLHGKCDSTEGYEECAKKGRQTMYIAWVQSQAIEKSLDVKSAGAVA